MSPRMVITANYLEPILAFEVFSQTATSFSAYEGDFQEVIACAGESFEKLCKEPFTQLHLCLRWDQKLHVRKFGDEDQEILTTTWLVAWPPKSGPEQSVSKWEEWIRRATQRISLRFFSWDILTLPFSNKCGLRAIGGTALMSETKHFFRAGDPVS